MPKVTEKYIEEKKAMILSAALAVIKKKPLFAITMQDIINKTGFSQGAMYRYFQDVDDILITILNKIYAEHNISLESREGFSNTFNPENAIKRMFSLLAQNLATAIPEYSKLSFELNLIYAAYPERAAKFRKALSEQHMYDVMLEKCFNYIKEQVELGYFKPRVSIDEIFSFAVSSYDGIVRNVTMLKCYSLNDSLPLHTKYDEVSLIEILCQTILYLLGSRNG